MLQNNKRKQLYEQVV